MKLPLVEAVLSSLLFDDFFDADASCRAFVACRLMALDANAARCCNALGACRDANNEA